MHIRKSLMTSIIAQKLGRFYDQAIDRESYVSDSKLLLFIIKPL